MITQIIHDLLLSTVHSSYTTVYGLRH